MSDCSHDTDAVETKTVMYLVWNLLEWGRKCIVYKNLNGCGAHDCILFYFAESISSHSFLVKAQAQLAQVPPDCEQIFARKASPTITKRKTTKQLQYTPANNESNNITRSTDSFIHSDPPICSTNYSAHYFDHCC